MTLRILRCISESKQDPLKVAVESFVERVRNLTDEQRRVVAARRREIDEAFHEKALRAGAESLPPHADSYVVARARVAASHLPTTLEQGKPDPEWVEISRLVQLAIDEGLVAVVGMGTLHPNHLRELVAPWPPAV